MYRQVRHEEDRYPPPTRQSAQDDAAIPLVPLSTSKLSKATVPTWRFRSARTWLRRVRPLASQLWQFNRSGWRVGILVGGCLATIVLLLNFIVTIIAMSEPPSQFPGRSILFRGDCGKTNKLDLIAHILINGMSTLLLSSSNYAMQYLSAPTRADIDRAHAKGVWLDVGVSSIKNLTKVSHKRAILWTLLLISSLPLHLFYNSAIFSTLGSTDYAVYSVNTSMLTNSSAARLRPLNVPKVTASHSGMAPVMIEQDRRDFDTAARTYDAAIKGKLMNLTVEQCIDRFAVQFPPSSSAVILVSSHDTTPVDMFVHSNLENLRSTTCISPFDWICNGLVGCSPEASYCPTAYHEIQPDDWRPLGNRIAYCLAVPEEEECMLQFATGLAWVIVVFNALKVAVLWTIYFAASNEPLLTIGDAICSFLERPDSTTQQRCLMSKREAPQWSKPPRSQTYRRSSVRTYHATVSGRRWATCLFLYAVAIGACLGLLVYGFVKRKQFSPATLMSLGFGAVDSATLTADPEIPSMGQGALIRNAFLANLPQLILSAIYFTYNGIFTCFMLGAEWDGYSKTRKGLRVSSQPTGAQRSTYFLQLPYRVALPLMVLSGVLHWLTSQSIFVVSVAVSSKSYRSVLQDLYGVEFITCGWSPSAIVSVICVGAAMVLAIVLTGRLRYGGTMPIASSCSAAISAACHPRERGDPPDPQRHAEIPDTPEAKSFEGADDTYEVEAATGMASLPLKWGDDNSVVLDDETQDAVRHCAFTSREVHEPQEGVLYR